MYSIYSTPTEIITDALSRASLKDSTPEISTAELNAYIHSILSNIPMSDTRLHQFQQETEQDETLSKLHHLIQTEWPNNRNDVEPSIRPYFDIRDELIINNVLILKGNRIVVPSSMCKKMLNVLHTAHPGIVKVKARARSTIYWPGIDAQLEDLTQSCSFCQEHRNKQPKEPQITHEIPTTPWTKFGTDLFHLFKQTYLIIVDYTTNYFDISKLPDAKSLTVVQHTKAIFAKYGIPKEIVSDNGPEFYAKAYNNFCKSWDIYDNPSSPEYPESNGLVERTIQTVKRTLRKVHKANEDIHLALLALKATPSNNHQSPASLFFNRSPHTLLPSFADINQSHAANVTKPLQSSLPSARHALPPLSLGDSVHLHDGKSWSKKEKLLVNILNHDHTLSKPKQIESSVETVDTYSRPKTKTHTTLIQIQTALPVHKHPQAEQLKNLNI